MNTPPAVVAPSEITRRDPRARIAGRHRTARREPDGRVNVGLWIPSTLIFAILAPFALLLLPFLYLAPRNVISSPARTVAGLGAVFLSMGGTVIEVDAPDCRVHIRLF